MIRKFLIAFVSFGLLGLPTQAQVQRVEPAPQADSVPVYRVTVIGRTTKAVNYRHRGGSTTIDFKGTPLLPNARGEAKVESKKGYIEIEVEFDDLEPATQFGPEYLTYVMWAITPEGRSTNLGEVLHGSADESKLNVTTELQAFGMVVTAEPHFAVTQPSDVVVMENVIRSDTRGKIEEIEARYELLQRGQYTLNVTKDQLVPLQWDRKTPLELHEARNAVRIARWAGAEQYASSSYVKAAKLLQQAEDYQLRKAGKRPVIMAAREAAQTAEDARLITVKRREEERMAQAKASEAQARASEAQAKAEADAEAARRALAEREKADAERARLQAESERRAAEEAARRAREQAAEQVAVSTREQAELRARLLAQLNAVLETRETARGLVINMPDVLFAFNRHELRPEAREKLAKVSGILLAQPGLALEVEGHADSVGSHEYNQQLSERRAGSARDFLVQQGVSSAAVASRGFGEERPVASNDTASGRQLNRRVEILVAGEVIGIPATESLKR
jgi:outer membrane protein OmpA-like peptidoglycan-associated protein